MSGRPIKRTLRRHQHLEAGHGDRIRPAGALVLRTAPSTPTGTHR